MSDMNFKERVELEDAKKTMVAAFNRSTRPNVTMRQVMDDPVLFELERRIQEAAGERLSDLERQLAKARGHNFLFSIMEVCKITARYNGSEWIVKVGMSYPAVEYTANTLVEALTKLFEDPKADPRGKQRVIDAVQEIDEE